MSDLNALLKQIDSFQKIAKKSEGFFSKVAQDAKDQEQFSELLEEYDQKADKLLSLFKSQDSFMKMRTAIENHVKEKTEGKSGADFSRMFTSYMAPINVLRNTFVENANKTQLLQALRLAGKTLGEAGELEYSGQILRSVDELKQLVDYLNSLSRDLYSEMTQEQPKQKDQPKSNRMTSANINAKMEEMTAAIDRAFFHKDDNAKRKVTSMLNELLTLISETKDPSAKKHLQFVLNSKMGLLNSLGLKEPVNNLMAQYSKVFEAGNKALETSPRLPVRESPF